MKNESVLVLAPPNMTAPRNGPNGKLGDRVHQLPAVAAATYMYERTYVWPADPVARELLGQLPIEFIFDETPPEVIKSAKAVGITTVFGLYADPTNSPTERCKDCEVVEACHQIATALSQGQPSIPDDLNPRGQVPLWRKLLRTVRPDITRSLDWPSLPFIATSRAHQDWANEFVKQVAGDKPTLILSPLSGAPKGAVPEDWWNQLASCFDFGQIIVPVHDAEVARAKALFAGAANVSIMSTDIGKTAALAALERVHVLGVDGGRMNVLAASRRAGVLTIYGEWPPSAWAMPNVVARGPFASQADTITPKEALSVCP